MRKTKKILAGILAAVLVTGLAGCGASSPEKTGSSDRTKVSMVIFGGGGQDTFDNAAAKFNEMQDEIELSIQPATGDYNLSFLPLCRWSDRRCKGLMMKDRKPVVV